MDPYTSTSPGTRARPSLDKFTIADVKLLTADPLRQASSGPEETADKADGVYYKDGNFYYDDYDYYADIYDYDQTDDPYSDQFVDYQVEFLNIDFDAFGKLLLSHFKNLILRSVHKFPTLAAACNK